MAAYTARRYSLGNLTSKKMPAASLCRDAAGVHKKVVS